MQILWLENPHSHPRFETTLHPPNLAAKHIPDPTWLDHCCLHSGHRRRKECIILRLEMYELSDRRFFELQGGCLCSKVDFSACDSSRKSIRRHVGSSVVSHCMSTPKKSISTTSSSTGWSDHHRSREVLPSIASTGHCCLLFNSFNNIYRHGTTHCRVLEKANTRMVDYIERQSRLKFF